ncbi:MAG: MarR family transcriptional regulator [Sphaerochaetaceae bacterium]
MKKYILLKMIEIGQLHRNLCHSYFMQYDISPSCPLILEILNENDGISMKTLAKLTNRDNGSITSSIKTLEKEGFVIKKQNLKDKRINLAFITDKGKKAVGIIKDYHQKTEEKGFLGFNEEEKKVFLSYLNRIEKNLSQEN